jgi:hypothetical protein
LIDGGNCAWNDGRMLLIESTTSIVFVPGCRWIASTTPRVPLNHAATFVFCTLSNTRPSSPRRTGAPLRYATISGA